MLADLQVPVAEPILTVKDLSFAYANGNNVFERLNFSLPRGGQLALVGGNGSGKSTLLKLLAGILPVRNGCVQVDGGEGGNFRRLVGYVGQVLIYDRSFPINVAEVVSAGLYGTKVGWRAGRRRVADTLAALELAHLAGRHFAQLSGGQRQKVLIARALVSEPKMLLLDEPTSALDQRAREEVLALLRRLEGNYTLVVASHERRVVRLLADHCLSLPQGGWLTKERGNFDDLE